MNVTNRHALLIGTAVLVAALVGPLAAHGDDCPDVPTESGQAKRLAGMWFAEGERLVREMKYEESLAGFLCSLKLAPHENTVFNIAQTFKLVDDREQAVWMLEDFVAENPSNSATGDIRELLGKIKGEEPADGSPLPAPGEDDEGPPGMEPTEEPEADPDEEGPPEDEAAEGEGIGMKTGGALLLGAAAVPLVVGVVLSGLSASAKKEAENATTYENFQGQEQAMKGRQAGAVVSFVIAGAASVAGIVMIAVGGDGEAEAAAGDDMAFAVRPGAGSLAFEGSF